MLLKEMKNMRILRLPEGARFTNKQIILFLLPVIFEQLMVAGLTMADTFMVSFLGETAVAGVALVSRIDNFAKQFFVALAQGGTVVLCQYIGAKNDRNAQTALKDNIRIVVFLGLIIMAVMVAFKNGILSTLYGNAEKDVLAISSTYFTVTAFSYPFVALYYAASATFRAMGESRIPFVSSIVMMVINIILKYIFIFLMDMGVTGAALSTLAAMATMGIILTFALKNEKNEVQLCGLFKFDLSLSISKKILTVSVPNGIEQGMFQLGALAIAGLVSGLGTASIAADSVARTVSPLVHSVGAAFNAAMLMIVGQCMGAGRDDEAVFFTKYVLKLDYIMTIAVSVIFMIFLMPLVSIFDVSAEAHRLAFLSMMVYAVGSIFFYPISFALASALRGAGDTKFVMFVSSASMFLFRIGAAYIFVIVFKMGLVGTWVAMVSDWVIRSIIFIVRFKKGKWKEHNVI